MRWAEFGNRRSVVSPDGPAAAPPQTVRRSRQHLQQSRGTAGRGSESLRGAEAQPRGGGDPALHVGFRRRGGSLGLWCVSARDVEKEGDGLN